MSISSLSGHQEWFFYLSQKERSGVSTPIAKNNKELLFHKYSENNKTRFACATAYIDWVVKGQNGEEPFTDVDIQHVRELLNNSAYDKVPEDNPAKVVHRWQLSVQDLTFFASKFKNFSWWSSVGSIGAAGLGLRYNSYRVLMVANLCMACALWVIRSHVQSIAAFCNDISTVIQDLAPERLNNFEGRIASIYEGLEKTTYFIKFYLRQQKATVEKDREGHLKLLQKQLYALSQIRNFAFRCTKQLDKLQQGEPDLNKIRDFFKNFEKLSKNGLFVSGSFTFLGAALTVYASMKKAYLMSLVGMICCIRLLAISKELFNLRNSSKKIIASQDEDMHKNVNEFVSKSKLFSSLKMDNPTLFDYEKIIVIPFDAILTLVPSWKTRVN